MKAIFVGVIMIFLVVSFVILNEAAAEQASGKPAWEVGSSKVCGDRLCSEISEYTIPDWVRNNAIWWSDGQISDDDFLSGIQFLIDNEIMKISAQTKAEVSAVVPKWIKDIAGWWGTGKISDDDFVNGMKWLIENGVIQVSAAQKAKCSGDALCLAERVQTVVDGDTIYIEGYKIRLSLTDTPERMQQGYSEAASFTKMLCPVGSVILVDQDDLQPVDKYGRILGKVFCSDINVNAELLENGHAVILTQYCDTSEFSSEAWAQTFGCADNIQDVKQPEIKTEPTPPKQMSCDPSYPDVCIPPYPPDLDCGEISYRNFKVLQPDPHRFDGDKDGIGCEG